MTNTTMKKGKLFLFPIWGNLRRFVAFLYKLLKVADVSIMHSVEKTV